MKKAEVYIFDDSFSALDMKTEKTLRQNIKKNMKDSTTLVGVLVMLTLPGKKGEENGVYDNILHLNWAQDYSDTYDELKVNHYEYLIHQPPM